MDTTILSYDEMCKREGGRRLQKGMNYRACADHSIILMSVRRDALYEDRFEEGGSVLIYEGHDIPRLKTERIDPKTADQAAFLASGNRSENGKFMTAAEEYRKGMRAPEKLRVYEKIHRGIWSYNGIFHLEDGKHQESNGRKVFKFTLVAVEGVEDDFSRAPREVIRRRVIPTEVKIAVWKRDHGCCVQCGAANELHFDHDLPWAKGGTSLTERNVQLLCARHNLEKRDNLV